LFLRDDGHFGDITKLAIKDKKKKKKEKRPLPLLLDGIDGLKNWSAKCEGPGGGDRRVKEPEWEM
jgi:hypothetical protein